jgi:hypothetical protein
VGVVGVRACVVGSVCVRAGACVCVRGGCVCACLCVRGGCVCVCAWVRVCPLVCLSV